MYKNDQMQPKQHKILIVGAGDAGVLVAKELQNTKSRMTPVAFVDDDPAKHHRSVFGLPIVGGCGQIIEVVQNLNIDTIVVAIPSASREKISNILNICYQTSATVKILPSVSEWIVGKNTTELIREVSMEDLLGREPIQVNLTEVSGYIAGQTVLVTGAGGSIGSEICRQIAHLAPNTLLLLGHGETSIFQIDLELRNAFPNLSIIPIIADIQNLSAIRQVFHAYGPNVVFHAAAHKHVTLMEMNPLEAIKNNVLGTRNVAQCAHETKGSHFVMISSDKAVNPTSVMGATKRLAELVIQSYNERSETKFSAVRFGNVLGSRGSVIPVFKQQIQKGGPVTVTHPEMVRYFMTIKEAVQLVIQAGALAKGGEIFILDMGRPVKIVDLAKDLIRLSGFRPDIDIPISFTGIRPGEKLFEELLTNEEGISATKHNTIFVSKPSGYCKESTSEFISIFESLSENTYSRKTPEEIKQLIFLYVPELYQTAGSALFDITHTLSM
ncbi:polysaccharide biosynthesis protein [Fodinisporobacter ferrooxydans]|uniref:Polysaccharide biosynthesis protein n=1 Tax=Fodinisporobacter ferrooxydans TaxID=2901836 RepID=A0ABY4CG31_9BACL|nr:polysaccharide biosynthesis protein [Alicyclobacillaceae bacterium MYW30-H2]